MQVKSVIHLLAWGVKGVPLSSLTWIPARTDGRPSELQ